VQTQSVQPVVTVAPVGNLGAILVTTEGFALYQWTEEKPGEIRCTDQCAKVWSPLLLPADRAVPERISSVAGTFGAIVRPDEIHQLTYDDHALLTRITAEDCSSEDGDRTLLSVEDPT
jgi:predicted lipoprotein with Yx(FWY)xxD motif